MFSRLGMKRGSKHFARASFFEGVEWSLGRDLDTFFKCSVSLVQASWVQVVAL